MRFCRLSLRRRANARNVSYRISLWWLTYIVNSVDETKLSCNTPTDAAPQFLNKKRAFPFGISFIALEIFTFLYYANEESDDIISGSVNAVQHSTKNISRNITRQKKQNDTHCDVAMITAMPLVFVLSLYPSLRECKRGNI